MLFFIYADRPGVVGTIGNKLAGAGINIEDMRHSHDHKTNRSLAILKVNEAPPPDVLDRIKTEIKPVTAVSIAL
jgi:D-3-phosphoglycerate dehydrogenase